MQVKSNRRKILHTLRNPSRRFISTVISISLITFAVSLAVLISGTQNSILLVFMFLGFSLNLLALGYLLFLLVILSPSIKETLTEFFKKNGFFRGYLRVYGYRTVVNTLFSILFNVSFIVVNGVIAIWNDSIWYGAFALFYTLLSWLRVLVVLHSRPTVVNGEVLPSSGGRYDGYVACLICSGMLILFPFAFAFAFMYSSFAESPFMAGQSNVYTIIIATYTFYRLVLAVINIIRAGKNEDLTIVTLRALVMVNALAAIPNLQATMLTRFFDNPAGMGIANSVTGVVVCAMMVLIGVGTLLMSVKKFKTALTFMEKIDDAHVKNLCDAELIDNTETPNDGAENRVRKDDRNS